VDLAGLSSAYGTRLLAALGAEVVVPEPPGGSPLRHWEPFGPGTGAPEGSLWWAYFAQGKHSVVLDDGEALRRLTTAADVVIESEAPDAGAALRSGVPDDVIWVSITPFGLSGPKRNWRGSALVAWASSSVLYTTGFPDRPPVSPAGPLQMPYHVAALYSAIAVQLALRARKRSGRGQHIDISLQEACLALAPETGGPLYLDDLVPRVRGGNRRTVTRPFGLYPCADGFVSFLVLQPAHWRAMAHWIQEATGEEALLDEAFVDPPVRWEASEFVDTLTEQLTLPRTKLDLFTEAQERGIPCTPVNTISDLRHDPHLSAAEFWRAEEHPHIGQLVGPGAPFRVDPAWWFWARAPLLGEHTETILESLPG
jgi:benzylsuccinate CoA-transferase BbsE subunit